jgi:glycosyltransferase involved in cell wall biosynthesis
MARVAVVINGLRAGGAERVVLDLLGRAKDARCDFVAVALEPGGELREAVRATGVPVADLGARARSDPSVVWRLARFLRAQRVNLVHAHLPRAGVIARLAAAVARVPVLYTEHNTWACYHGVTRRLNRLTLPLCREVTAVSARVVTSMGAAGRRRPVTVVPNGLDIPALCTRVTRSRAEVRAELGLPADACLLVNVANLRPEKGHGVLLEGAAAVCARVPRAHLAIVGLDLGQGAALRADIARRGLTGRVQYLGYRADVPDLLAASDVFVLSSLQEGMPLALLEAQALGVPAVVTDVGGNAEVVQTGTTGAVVPPGDPAALAEALTSLALDVAARERYAAAARRRLEQEFSVERMATRYHALYARLLGAA